MEKAPDQGSPEFLPQGLDMEKKKWLRSFIADLKSSLESFKEKSDDDARARLSVQLSGLINKLKNYRPEGMDFLESEARNLAKCRVKNAIDYIQHKLQLVEVGKMSVLDCQASGLVNHYLYNAFQSYSSVGLRGEPYKRSLIARAHIFEAGGSYDQAANTLQSISRFFEGFHDENTERIEELKEKSDSDHISDDEIEQKAYEIVTTFLNEIKDDELMHVDVQLEINKTLERMTFIVGA